MIEVDKKRKIPKPIRKLNFLYKVLMALLTGINLALSVFSDVNDLYYKIVSVIISILPVVWSEILDATKIYIDDKTPSPLSPASPNNEMMNHNQCSDVDGESV